MKNKHLYFVIGGLILVVALTFYLPMRPPAVAKVLPQRTTPAVASRVGPDALKRDEYGRFAHMSVEELMRNRPKMHATKGFPPKTPEELEMWQWWNAIDKADMSFEWKMPVEFYGKVVDQREQPVSGATILWSLAILGGSKSGSMLSQADGKFTISGQIGKTLDIHISKLGYNSGVHSVQAFEYAAFHEDGFIIPDANNPIVFHLQKLDHPEPLYQNRLTGTARDDGTPVSLDLRLGQVTTDGQGDLVLRFTRHAQSASFGDAYSIALSVPSGGGLSPSTEEFMDLAPETGYQTAIQTDQPALQGSSDITFHPSQKFRFYLKTPDGHYAAVTGNVVESNDAGSLYNFTVYYNPSGSRNLAVDMKQIIRTPTK